jgi:hypothetical protein
MTYDQARLAALGLIAEHLIERDYAAQCLRLDTPGPHRHAAVLQLAIDSAARIGSIRALTTTPTREPVMADPHCAVCQDPDGDDHANHLLTALHAAINAGTFADAEAAEAIDDGDSICVYLVHGTRAYLTIDRGEPEPDDASGTCPDCGAVGYHFVDGGCWTTSVCPGRRPPR